MTMETTWTALRDAVDMAERAERAAEEARAREVLRIAFALDYDPDDDVTRQAKQALADPDFPPVLRARIKRIFDLR
jgi:hypothetical protein